MGWWTGGLVYGVLIMQHYGVWCVVPLQGYKGGNIPQYNCHPPQVDETAVFDVSREPVILNIYDMFWTNDYTANVGLGVGTFIVTSTLSPSFTTSNTPTSNNTTNAILKLTTLSLQPPPQHQTSRPHPDRPAGVPLGAGGVRAGVRIRRPPLPLLRGVRHTAQGGAGAGGAGATTHHPPECHTSINLLAKIKTYLNKFSTVPVQAVDPPGQYRLHGAGGEVGGGPCSPATCHSITCPYITCHLHPPTL